MNIFKSLISKIKEPKSSLIHYFVKNKVTFPISKNTTYSHANVEDIKYLQSVYPNISIIAYETERYPRGLVYTIINNNQTVTIIDENSVKGINEIVTLIMDLINYVPPKKKDNIIQLKRVK